MNRTIEHKLALIGIAVGAMALSGCDRTPPAKESGKSPSFSSQIESASKSVEKAAGTAADKTKEAVSSAGDKIEAAADKTKVAASDTAITAAVKSKFIADPDLKAIDINVDTSDGAVTLKGTVDSAGSREKATRVASQVDGVKSVTNLLALRK